MNARYVGLRRCHGAYDHGREGNTAAWYSDLNLLPTSSKRKMHLNSHANVVCRFKETISQKPLILEDFMHIAASSLKKKLVSQAIQDPLFKRSLQDAAQDIVIASKSAPNEATIESSFELSLYAVMRDIGLSFNPQKEIPIKTRRHTARGRTDSRIGALIIEYKQPSTLRTQTSQNSAIQQLADYVEALFAELGNEIVGYLTDGTKTLEIRASSEGTTIGPFAPLDGKTLERLVRSVISLEKSALTAVNLIRDFCGSKQDGIVFDVARKLNNILTYQATMKTEMLRTEWESLFRLAHEDQSQQRRIQDRRDILSSIFSINITSPTMEYKALFSLHTAYAIILKMIAYRVVSDVKFGTVLQDYKSLTVASHEVMQSFATSLEDGELFRQIGILNLLEGDFFSWYADENQWDESISDGIRDILVTLARYEDTRTIFESANAVDLFRSLYEATVPQVVRSSLGEFYTPYWLAEHVLESSGLEGEWTALDPCCGSGTFVIAAIAKIREKANTVPSKELASNIIKRVAGIDLNPLAVLTSRIHFFIHIADLLENFDDEIAIPIYLGDASNLPTRVQIEGVDFIHYELKTLKTPLSIDIPATMAVDLLEFARTMFEFERYIKTSDYSEAKSYLLKKATAGNENEIICRRIGELADQIINLEKQQWNGIWARMIANFIATAEIGPFTNIVGNPPWIDWKSLPSGYREKVKGLCIDKGLFSGAGRTGGINLNVCALIAHVAATNWLAPEGRMALLMPRELANQASYEGWRRAVGGKNCSLIALHDWSDAGHPFDPVKEDFMTYVFEAKDTQNTLIPVTHYVKNDRRSKAHLWETLNEAVQKLDPETRVAGQIVKGSTGYTFALTKSDLNNFKKIAGKCPYIGREGVEFYPQELLLFNYDSPGPKKGTIWVKNIQVSKSKYKIPQQKVLLETEYLFPLVKGPGIEGMNYKDPDILVVFPYDESNPYTPVPKSVLKKRSPLLLQFFEKYKKIIEKQTHYSDSLRAAGEFYGLARTGPYSFRNCYVAYRDNTKWRATVITEKTMPWGSKKRYLFQNHAVSMCERVSGGIITEEEAYYVAGILNAPIVAKFIYASSDNRSFKIRPPIYMPEYENGNATHAKIVKLAKEITTDQSSLGKNSQSIEKLYLSLCKGR